MQAEGVQHLGGALERHSRALPSNSHGGEKDRNELILAPRQAVARMPSDLQNELPVPAFMQETAGRRPFHRQTAEDERARREAHILLFAFPVLADHLDRLNLPKPPLRNDRVGRLLPEQIACALQL